MTINPYDTPEAYDHFVLAGQLSPGLCTDMAGAGNPRGWDEKKGTGVKGATLTYTGDGLARWPAKIQLGWGIDGRTIQQEWEDWDAFKALLVPPTKKNPEALDFYHPIIEALPVPINAVVIDDVIAPKQVQDGIWEIEIKFRQYRKPEPAQATATGSKSNRNAPSDPVDDMIKDLTNQVKDLAK